MSKITDQFYGKTIRKKFTAINRDYLKKERAIDSLEMEGMDKLKKGLYEKYREEIKSLTNSIKGIIEEEEEAPKAKKRVPTKKIAKKKKNSAAEELLG